MHDVYLNAWETTVIKLPRPWNTLSRERAQESLVFFRQFFSDCMPETRLLPHGKESYIVEQEFVEGKTLEQYLAEWQNLDTVRNRLEEFIWRSLRIIEETWVWFDIIGTPDLDKKNARKWAGCTNFIISNEWNISFIDNVSNVSLWIPPTLNKIINKLFIWRRRRKENIFRLLEFLK